MLRFSGKLFTPYDKNWFGVFQPMRFLVADEDILYDSVCGDYVSFYTMDQMWTKLGLLAVLTLICYLTARYFYLYSEGGQYSMFRRRWLNTAFQLSVSILAGMFIGRMNNMTRYGLGVVVVLMVLASCSIFIVFRRFQGSERKVKHEK